jgi:hypothetical protein
MLGLGWLLGPFPVLACLLYYGATSRCIMAEGSDHDPLLATTTMPQSKFASSKVALSRTALRFSACLSRDKDVNIKQFVNAAAEFYTGVERFGDFTQRGVRDGRKNIRRIEKAIGGGISSMRALLNKEVQRGARRPDGGPASSSGAEALLWSRLGLSLWVEIFKEHAKTRAPLPEATRNGFKRSLARYLDRFGRAAFNLASRSAPDWDVVSQRTQLGCHHGVCSDEHLANELGSFAKKVQPVIDRMTELQKSVGLEDPRTP